MTYRICRYLMTCPIDADVGERTGILELTCCLARNSVWRKLLLVVCGSEFRVEGVDLAKRETVSYEMKRNSCY